MISIDFNQFGHRRFFIVPPRVFGFCNRILLAVYQRKKYYLRTGAVRFLNRNLKIMLNRSMVLQKRLSKMDAPEAKAAYPLVKRLHLNFTKVYAALEEVNFLTNPQTREIAEAALSNYFDAEFQYRLKAFCDDPSNKHDKKLTEFASMVSLNSIQTPHAI